MRKTLSVEKPEKMIQLLVKNNKDFANNLKSLYHEGGNGKSALLYQCQSRSDFEEHSYNRHLWEIFLTEHNKLIILSKGSLVSVDDEFSSAFTVGVDRVLSELETEESAIKFIADLKEKRSTPLHPDFSKKEDGDSGDHDQEGKSSVPESPSPQPVFYSIH